MEPQFVESVDTKTVAFLASKLLEQMRSIQSKKDVGKLAEYRSIFYSLCDLARDENLVVFKDGDHIIGALAYTIEQPWYTRATCLDEVFVLQTDPNFYGFGRVALDFLKMLAKTYGCSLMETGASMTDTPEMLRNLYLKKGKCDFEYPNFVWVLPN